uniref:Anaphase-promoting complex subunit 4 WD40 domain-containing protein n=1 Tax=Ciona savignyi TaxID=51511 RepID=H2YWB5_CIOSA
MAKSFSPLRDDFRRIYSFPSNKIVSIAPAAQLVLLQYPTFLEVWKMARIVDSDSSSTKVIAQEENPIKILQLKIPSSSDEHIKCSNISPCGRWIVYSTLSTCRLYQLQYNTEEGSVKMQKIRCSGLSPSNVIQFSCDSTYMISATTGHKLIITKLDAQAYTATLVHSHSVKSHTTPIHLIATSRDTKYMATANLDSNVDIFSIKDMKHVGSLPRYPRIPTALSFHPETNDVNVVYDDLKIFEFSIKEMSYTPFTRRVLASGGNFLHDLRNDASKKHSNVAIVTNILHICNQDKDVVLCISREGLFIIEKPCGKKTEVSARFCRQFMPLLHCDVIDTSTLIAVERPLQDIWQQLPATLYQKKF